VTAGANPLDLDEEYQALSEFRYQIRKFLHFSEQAARAAGLEPSQHQALLALKALGLTGEPNIRDLAERMQLKHHSAVGLIDRLASKGLVRRGPGKRDRREVTLCLTEHGESVLRDLSLHHRRELQSAGPELLRVLEQLIRDQNHER